MYLFIISIITFITIISFIFYFPVCHMTNQSLMLIPAVCKRFHREKHTFSPSVLLLDHWLYKSAGKLCVNLITVQQSTSS